MGFDSCTKSTPGNHMGDLMGNGLLHESIGVLIQDLLIVTNLGINPGPEDYHAGGFAFEIERDVRVLQGKPITFARGSD
jgi:hypothetical protein